MSATAPPVRTDDFSADVEPELRYVRMSLADFEQLPEQTKAEWVDGWAIIMSPPRHGHNRLVLKLATALDRDLDGVEVLPGSGLAFPVSRRIPDIMVIPSENYDPQTVWDFIPPVLVVEVLSDGTWRNDLLRKADEYAAAGIPHYWVVDPGTSEILIRENRAEAWYTAAVLSATNPELEVAVADRGVVHLRHADIFGQTPTAN